MLLPVEKNTENLYIYSCDEDQLRIDHNGLSSPGMIGHLSDPEGL